MTSIVSCDAKPLYSLNVFGINVITNGIFTKYNKQRIADLLIFKVSILKFLFL